MRFRLSLLLLETRALHTKHQHHRKQKKCRRPVRRRLRRAEHSRFGSSSTFIPKGALKKDQKRVRWFRKDSSLLLCGKEREKKRRKEEQKKIGIFCVTDKDPKLTRGKKNAKVKHSLSPHFLYSVFLSFFLSFFLSNVWTTTTTTTTTTLHLCDDSFCWKRGDVVKNTTGGKKKRRRKKALYYCLK